MNDDTGWGQTFLFFWMNEKETEERGSSTKKVRKLKRETVIGLKMAFNLVK